MNTFTASNGIQIADHRFGKAILDDDGTNRLASAFDFLNTNDIDALREFFRAEEDERLGRVRIAGFPGLYAYRYNSDWVNVVDEHDGAATEHRRQDVDASRHRDFVSESERFARAYFDAHPEPKPWESAADGDIWELTSDGKPGQYLHDRGRFFALPLLTPSDPAWRPAGFASNFTAGRRIWPEDAS